MKKRVQVLLNEEDVIRFTKEAEEKQISLSALLRYRLFKGHNFNVEIDVKSFKEKVERLVDGPKRQI